MKGHQAVLILTLGLGAILVSGCSRAITGSPSAIPERIADQDCVLSSADRKVRNVDHLDFVAWQEVRWVEEDHALSYQVGLTALHDGKIGVRLQILNLGFSDALVMTETRWVAGYTEDSVSLSLGSSAGNYGNEIPALESLEPGACFADVEVVEIGGTPAPFIESLDVGFFGIFGDLPALKGQLEGLPEVQGWWQTSDLDLTDRYYEHLAYPMISFTLPADSPIMKRNLSTVGQPGLGLRRKRLILST